jgi:hypothetical protein
MQSKEIDHRFQKPPTLFFVVGAQKSGTTWLHDYLANHPQVRVPTIKELHYWDTIRPPYTKRFQEIAARHPAQQHLRSFVIGLIGNVGQRRRQREWSRLHQALSHPDPSHRAYADILVPNGYNALAVGECTPEYGIAGQEVLREIAELSPRSRFLFIMRDPVERLIAGVRHRLRRETGCRDIDAATLNQALWQVLAEPNHQDMLMSRYDKTLADLEAIVPTDRIHTQFYERLFNDASISSICSFLGIEIMPADYNHRSNADRGTQAPVEAELLLKIRATLDPVYRDLQTRFGDNLPWPRFHETRLGAISGL